MTISDTTRQPDTRQHEDKRVWVEVSDPSISRVVFESTRRVRGSTRQPVYLFNIFYIPISFYFNFKFLEISQITKNRLSKFHFRFMFNPNSKVAFGSQNVFGWSEICQRNLTLKELEWNIVRFDHLFG